MSSERIIFHWDPEDDPNGNWQHVFEGHDVEPDEVEAFIDQYWDVRAAWIPRPDDTFVVIGTSGTGRILAAALEILDRDPPRVRVFTCYPVEA